MNRTAHRRTEHDAASARTEHRTTAWSQGVRLIDGARTPFLKVRGRPSPFRRQRPRTGGGPRPAEPRRSGARQCRSGRAGLCHRARTRPISRAWWRCAWAAVSRSRPGQCSATALPGCRHWRAPPFAGHCRRAHHLVLAGGTRAMSHHPVMLNELMTAWLGTWNQAATIGAAAALLQPRPAHFRLVVALLRGPYRPGGGLSMGTQTAEELAERFRDHACGHGRLRAAQPPAPGSNRRPGRVGRDRTRFTTATGNVYAHDDGLRPDSRPSRRWADCGRCSTARSAASPPATAPRSAMALRCFCWRPKRPSNDLDLPVPDASSTVSGRGLDPAQMGLGPVHAMAPIMQRHGFDSMMTSTSGRSPRRSPPRCWHAPARGPRPTTAGTACSATRRSPIRDDRLDRRWRHQSRGTRSGASGARITLHALRSCKPRDGGRYRQNCVSVAARAAPRCWNDLTGDLA